jgi:hypothetical protein
VTKVTTLQWDSLRKQRDGSRALIVEYVDPDVPHIRIGIDEDGCLHLIIEIHFEPEKIPQELEAIMVRVIEMDGLYLDIFARGHYEMIFTPLVNQIFNGITLQGRNVVDVVRETIEQFRNALKPVRPILSLSEQIGLFGEIWILLNVLIPNLGSRACMIWSGPDFERHDFVGSNVHLEIKTTTRSEDKHEISRIDQLRTPPGKRLLLASVQLERSQGAAHSVATLIDQVIDSLGSDGIAIDEFELKLSKAGWNNTLRQSSELRKFNLRDVQFFEVEGSFPRLPDDYCPPRGVTSIKYVIDISARPVLDRSTVQQIIRHM